MINKRDHGWLSTHAEGVELDSGNMRESIQVVCIKNNIIHLKKKKP